MAGFTNIFVGPVVIFACTCTWYAAGKILFVHKFFLSSIIVRTKRVNFDEKTATGSDGIYVDTCLKVYL